MNEGPEEPEVEDGDFDFEAAARAVEDEIAPLRDFLAGYGYGVDGEQNAAGLAGAAFADSVVCAFELGSQSFAIEVGAVREVLQVDSISPVPLTHSALLGVSACRGTMLGVVDLAALLGLEHASQPEGGAIQVLVLELEGCLFGARIDRALGIGPAYPADEIEFGETSAPPTTSGRIALDRSSERTALRIDPVRLAASVAELTRTVSTN